MIAVFALLDTTNLADTREGGKAYVALQHPRLDCYVLESQRYGIGLPNIACEMPYHVDTDMMVAVVAIVARFALYAIVVLVSLTFLLGFVRAHLPSRIAILTPFGLGFLCLDPGRSPAIRQDA